ncbi:MULTISPECIES: hypothetical protein [Rhodomicrobium]|uniref:hypothetical protein n=1 Tax=Rhodomicrobium TaxID=1068 RepID=UPI000B4BC54A|nr:MULTISPECIES: hypothetical protein [Rhodomicrobium]
MAGCETSSSGSGDPVASALTSPQQPQQAQAKPIAFAPVIGAPAKVSSKMNELLVASAGQQGIPVVASKDAEYTIRGYLVAAADPKGTKLSYIWDVTDKSGKRAKRLQGDELIEGKKGGDPWTLVDDAAMQRIAAKTTEQIVAWMPSAGTTASTGNATENTAPAQGGQPRQAAAQPVANVLSAQTAEPAAAPSANAGVPIAVVPPVTGAPGDGQASLTSAMRRHLQQAGVKLVESDDPTAYTVRGSVQLGTAESGQQPITIRWLVVDPSGKTMEKAVVQRNKVPEGSLDGTWGQVAELAAGEAARSVAKLIKPAT